MRRIRGNADSPALLQVRHLPRRAAGGLTYTPFCSPELQQERFPEFDSLALPTVNSSIKASGR